MKIVVGMPTANAVVIVIVIKFAQKIQADLYFKAPPTIINENYSYITVRLTIAIFHSVITSVYCLLFDHRLRVV